jgi:hypothetical protein
LPVPAADFVPSERTTELLRKARSDSASHTTWQVGGGAAAAFGVLALLLFAGVASVANPETIPLMVGVGVALVPIGFFVIGLLRAKKRAVELGKHLEDAWVSAARDYLALRPATASSELTKLFGQGGDSLVTRLSSENDVSTQVTDEGELALSVGPEKARVKVPDATSEGNDGAVKSEAEAEAKELRGERS